MNNQELKKFGKKELLEILLSQAKRIEELEEELTKTNKKLESKKITIENSGSLAEAALKLNNIFESAESAAEQYLLNIKEKCKKIEADTKKDCLNRTNKILEETEKACQKKKAEAEAYLIEIKAKKNNNKKRTNKSTTQTKKVIKSNETKINNLKKESIVKLEKMKKEI